MPKLRFLSSGESHGPELNIILEGIPANMELLEDDINHDLKRRQGGYGRGGRMKIETDKVIFTGGIRHGRSFGGAPLAMKLINKDHQKWLNVMNFAPVDDKDPEVKSQLDEKYISKVRPGHADLAGALKYNAPDVRDILERSSARETTSRVATGAVCKKFLSYFGIEVFSHVLRIGPVAVDNGDINPSNFNHADLAKFKEKVDASEFRVYDSKNETALKQCIDETRKKGDTLGGVLEVFARGVPVGLGTHVQWDRRLDAIIAQSLMSVHTVKSVELGSGLNVGTDYGSEVHDQIYINENYKNAADLSIDDLGADFNFKDYFRYTRKTNNLGGFEGGMTNGEPILARVAVKPIPTLVSKLDAVDLDTKAASLSHFERSDVCVVPAAGVVLEAMLAYSLAEAILDKFAGDSITETQANYLNYLKQISLR